MKNNEEVRAELAEIAPFLASIRGNKEGFKVPEGHFEKLQKQVLQQVASSEVNTPLMTASVKKSGMLNATWFRPAMAATVIGVAICALFYLYFEQHKSSSQLAALTHEEISNYVNSNLDDFEEDLLIKNSEALFEAPTNFIKTEELDRFLKESIDDLDIEEIENL